MADAVVPEPAPSVEVLDLSTLNNETILRYAAIQRIKNKVSSNTFSSWVYTLVRYAKWFGKDPDAIIAERRLTLKSDDFDTNQLHENKMAEFLKELKTRKVVRDGRETTLSPWSIATARAAILALYRKSGVELKDTADSGLKPYTVRSLHIPSRTELGAMMRVTSDDIVGRAAMLAASASGMSEGDMLELEWSMESPDFGSIEKQVAEGIMIDGVKYNIVHVHRVRTKESVPFDTFLSSLCVKQLKVPEYPHDDLRVFPIGVKVYRDRVSKAGEAIGYNDQVRITAHGLRKYFSTELYTARAERGEGGSKDFFIERMMGHATSITGTYTVPEPKRLAKIYLTQMEPLLLPQGWP